jgi:glycosyltransferase involved in cell wall biosynthesis
VDGLEVSLETPLPAELPAGLGTALFLAGTCFHPTRRIRELLVVVGGEPQRVTAAGMPRFDVFAGLHPGLGSGEEALPERDPSSEQDPEIRCWRSGFWATVRVPADTAPGTEVALRLRARLDDGESSEAELGSVPIRVASPVASEPGPGGAGTIAVCMSTHDPDLGLFKTQIESLRRQTDTDWVCVVSDDCSSRRRFGEIQEVLAGDERFVLSRSERRLGFYRGFERALSLAPPEAPLVALCDQDDRWYPEKLATLRAELGRAQLVYSDQRLVTADGETISETYWRGRANNHTNLISLLVANTITGAASLMRRGVVARALPFPDVPGEQYHDHWLGLIAMTLGEVAYVDQPLYDYVQHGGAVLGHAAANAGANRPSRLTVREHLRLGGVRRLLGDGRGAYFFVNQRLSTLAAAAVVRCRPGRRKRRALERFIRSERQPVRGVLWLWARPLRRLSGRDETLGIERLLVQGILWRWAIRLRAGRALRPSGWTYDASIPPFEGGRGAPFRGEPATAHLQRIIAPLELAASDREPERVNVLIPTIDLKHLFGGYIAKFNLARRLAESGHRVRIVAIDPTPRLPADWRRQVEAYSGLEGALERVEVVFAREADSPLPVNPRDRFVATTWWSAHVAHAAVQSTSRARFLYLIQEYEPFTFEMGSLAALAMESYRFPHVALFSTELLREFFARHGHGVFSAGLEEGKRNSTSFQNAITPVEPPSVADLASRSSRRLLFYARAEQHARRNMFELGLIALSQAIERGVFGTGWEFMGVGSVGGRSRLGLPAGAQLEILPRMAQAQYGAMLSGHDVGLSLMFTPHPSLVPIEMASAGLITVTNTFDVKTPQALAAISPNLIATEPTIDGVVAGLAEAVARVDEHERRVAGATVSWSSSWERSLDQQVMGAIEELLESC